MNEAIAYLRSKEWSMGNGQCPECCGVPEKWHGHPLHMTPDTIGHKANCKLAASLTALGEKPLMLGDYQSAVEYEMFINDFGAFGTRLKTAEGCPRYREWSEKLINGIEDAIFDVTVQAPTPALQVVK